MSFVSILFWSSGLLIFYSYAGYPLVLWVISLFKQRPLNEVPKPYKPKVTLFISAYNEEKVIEEKIQNSLNINYPKDLFEIVVVSDGSCDRTREIVSRYATEGVKLRSYEGRIGKSACLNKAVPLAEGEIVVFSDANSKYDPDAVKMLVDRFRDRQVGLVTGTTRYISEQGGSLSESIGLYWEIEKMTKSLETRIGSCVGADGAIFAIRKELYQPLESHDINDLVIPLNVIEQGCRVILETRATCREHIPGRSRDEFNRQVRITNRTIRAIVNRVYLLNPFKYGLLSFKLFSHKVCRLLVPFFIPVFFITNLILISRGTLYFMLLNAQLLFYLLAGLNNVSPGLKFLSRLTSISHTFSLANLAILSGWIKYLKGEKSIVWAPSRD